MQNSKLMKIHKARQRVREARKWIEDCEANGVSYTGENGWAIRRADERALKRREAELAALEGRA